MDVVEVLRELGGVLRFAWEDVMHDAAHVRMVLRAVVVERAQVGRSSPGAA